MRDNPNLSPEQIDHIRSVAQLRSVQAGEVLYEPSQPDVPLFIVLEGNVSISRTGEDDKILAVREATQFTGEMSVISGKRSLLKARVTGDGSVLELSRDKVLSLMAKDTELGEIFMEAFVARRLLMIQLGEGNVVLFGTKISARTLALREFLTRNAHPFSYVDIDSDSFASELMEKLAVRNSEIPVVYCNNRYVLRNPSIAELAQCLDLNINTDKSVRDVVVIGAGPAGLAAAVYAASEGLRTLVIEKSAPGGQAGSSSRIENYLGFPTGISGMNLMARAYHQAQKFGVEMAIPNEAISLGADAGGRFTLGLHIGERLRARSVVLAMGVRYRRLDIDNLGMFEASSVHYWASPLEARLCAGQEVALVGAGNSAGQGAVYLAGQGARVWMLVRGSDLSATMSRYLVERIRGLANVNVVTGATISGLEGREDVLEVVRWRSGADGDEVRREIKHLFLFIGAEPKTGWLGAAGIGLDPKGFILTGENAGGRRHALETTRRGVFAIGDARSGSIKRVAAGVGEGAAAVAQIHAYLAALRPRPRAIEPA